MRINLGCGNVRKPGYVGVDQFPGEAVDVVTDASRLPFASDSVEEVYASHVIEHVLDMHALMVEIHRVLIPGGRLKALVPYGLRSLYDPFHLHAFDYRTFRFFTRNNGFSRSLQNFPLFDLEEIRLDTVTQFVQHIPPLHYAIESRPKLAWLLGRLEGTTLFHTLSPKGRWPQLVVILRKPEANA